MEAVETVAVRVGATPGQVALTWLLAQGDDVVPIPGTTRRAHLDENLAAAAITLTDADLDDLRRLLDAYTVAGDRYPPSMMRTLET